MSFFYIFFLLCNINNLEKFCNQINIEAIKKVAIKIRKSKT